MEKNKTANKKENLHAKHRDRMFNKFFSTPYEAIPDHELLEMILFFSRLRMNTNETAHQLISKYGSFYGVFEASRDDLKQVDQIGDYNAWLIKLVRACVQRYNDSWAKIRKEIVTTEDAGEYFVNLLKGKTRECLTVLMLDNSEKIINYKHIAEGAVNHSPVCIRTLFEAILSCNAAGIYIAHNHPRGNTVPSNDDLSITAEIRDLCYRMNINFMDHIIVAEDKYSSVMDYIEKER